MLYTLKSFGRNGGTAKARETVSYTSIIEPKMDKEEFDFDYAMLRTLVVTGKVSSNAAVLWIRDKGKQTGDYEEMKIEKTTKSKLARFTYED